MDSALPTALTGPDPASGTLIVARAYARARGAAKRPISLVVELVGRVGGRLLISPRSNSFPLGTGGLVKEVRMSLLVGSFQLRLLHSLLSRRGF